MTKEEFGKYLKSLRKNKKLTIKELAKKAEVSHPYISQLENGHFKPSTEVITKLAGHLGESPINLMVKAGHINLEDDFNTKTTKLLKNFNDLFKGRRKNVAIVHLTTVIFSKLDELIVKYESNPLAVISFKKTNNLLTDYLNNNEITIDEVIQQNSLETEEFEEEIVEDKGIIFLMLETLRHIEEQEIQLNALNQQLNELKNKSLDRYIIEEDLTYKDHVLSDEDKQRLIDMLPILFPQYQSGN
ncbi:helix-turn-helix domain-containing protein [Paenibacillus lactis]|uniref:helix-turn-helix domain-containing protein n=1 Tax=Paenibacillus lactis TaxID=228574 RepID=UPI0036C787DF